MTGEGGGANEGSILRLPRDRQPLPVIRASAKELERHEAKLDDLDHSAGGSIWRHGIIH
jgi:DNA polymerase-3 subunit epsilon